MLSIKQGSIKYHFWVFGITWPGIEPCFVEPLTNILTIMTMIWSNDNNNNNNDNLFNSYFQFSFYKIYI